MKVFEDNKKWNEKVNFVDDNNVFVGYDLSQDCCEHADWFIYSGIFDANYNSQTNDGCEKTEYVLEGYNFDTNFFQEKDDGYGGGIVIFKLVNSSGDEKYLHLFNVQNGYYSHGFEMLKDDLKIRDGYI